MTWIQPLGREDPLEEGLATHSSVLAWRIPWTEECGGLQFVGPQRARHDQSHHRRARSHLRAPGEADFRLEPSSAGVGACEGSRAGPEAVPLTSFSLGRMEKANWCSTLQVSHTPESPGEMCVLQDANTWKTSSSCQHHPSTGPMNQHQQGDRFWGIK